jgi:RNA polymerase sigma-70 factor, ECF subfamily
MTLGDAFESALVAAKTGEEWAWSVIYRDLAGPVTGYLRGHGAADAEDLVSETFLQVARGILTFSGNEDAFRSWVFVIAHRRLIDARRKAARRPLEAMFATESATIDAIEGGNAETDAIAVLDPGSADAFLATLTRDQRDVIKLRVVVGLSVADTARVLGKSPGAVRVLQHRALEVLRTQAGETP